MSSATNTKATAGVSPIGAGIGESGNPESKSQANVNAAAAAALAASAATAPAAIVTVAPINASATAATAAATAAPDPAVVTAIPNVSVGAVASPTNASKNASKNASVGAVTSSTNATVPVVGKGPKKTVGFVNAVPVSISGPTNLSKRGADPEPGSEPDTESESGPDPDPESESGSGSGLNPNKKTIPASESEIKTAIIAMLNAAEAQLNMLQAICDKNKNINSDLDIQNAKNSLCCLLKPSNSSDSAPAPAPASASDSAPAPAPASASAPASGSTTSDSELAKAIAAAENAVQAKRAAGTNEGVAKAVKIDINYDKYYTNEDVIKILKESIPESIRNIWQARINKDLTIYYTDNIRKQFTIPTVSGTPAASGTTTLSPETKAILDRVIQAKKDAGKNITKADNVKIPDWASFSIPKRSQIMDYIENMIKDHEVIIKEDGSDGKIYYKKSGSSSESPIMPANSSTTAATTAASTAATTLLSPTEAQKATALNTVSRLIGRHLPEGIRRIKINNDGDVLFILERDNTEVKNPENMTTPLDPPPDLIRLQEIRNAFKNALDAIGVKSGTAVAVVNPVATAASTAASTAAATEEQIAAAAPAASAASAAATAAPAVTAATLPLPIGWEEKRVTKEQAATAGTAEGTIYYYKAVDGSNPAVTQYERPEFPAPEDPTLADQVENAVSNTIIPNYSTFSDNKKTAILTAITNMEPKLPPNWKVTIYDGDNTLGYYKDPTNTTPLIQQWRRPSVPVTVADAQQSAAAAIVVAEKVINDSAVVGGRHKKRTLRKSKNKRSPRSKKHVSK